MRYNLFQLLISASSHNDRVSVPAKTLSGFGYRAEIILDTVLFWMSRLEWHAEQERYELCGTIGADEYHERVNNNTFTNRMVQWHLEQAVAVYEWLQQTFPVGVASQNEHRATALAQQLQLTSENLLLWQTMIVKLYIPHNPKTGLIEQFEGFFKLQDIDLSKYEPRDRSMQAVCGFGGIQLQDSGPIATPHLPPTWTRLKFKLNWRGTWHSFDLVPPSAHAPEIQGFIFDLDGVLTDTAEFHYRAWQQLADEEHLPFNRQANEALRGVARRTSLMLIVGDRPYSEDQIQEMMERKNR